MHVAVIGAGAAGLCTARHLTSPSSGFTCVVFEQTSSIGGVWVYTDKTGNDEYGLPIGSVMYKNLRTNLPKDNMEFPGFSFKNSKSFMKHNDVLQYLQDYANHYNLMNHIKLASEVLGTSVYYFYTILCEHADEDFIVSNNLDKLLHYVKHIIPKNKKWQITSTNLPERTDFVEEFDAVVICNGHNSIPYMEDISGISEFEGEVKHSHTYRTPELFSNKTVLVCGGGPSGIDITYDIANFASKVYLSHKNKIKQSSLPENVIQVPLVKHVKKNVVEFLTGSISDPLDIILLCTGYKYNFPFLTPECGITVVNSKFVRPLYKDIVNINNPTMGFIGIPFQTFIFPLFDYQVQFYLKTLKGEVDLPCREDMLAALENKILQNQEKGVPDRNYHQLGDKMRPYLEDLANAAQLEHLPPVIYKIYDDTKYLRETRLESYREVQFERLDDDNYFKTDDL